jgi:two-component system sensor histidine kinase KdpD
MVELLDGEIDRLDRVVTGLVEMTRYQSGGAAPAGEPQAILDLVAEATAGMRASLGERAVDVLVPDDLPAVMVDRVLVVQVIVNLLDNAHRHAAPGSALTVSAAADGDQVVVSVADEGPGVAPDDAAALFDGLLRPGRGGRSGLGLWICRTFVEAHGGRIWLDPDYRRGARFCFSLPTEHVADRPAAEVRA